MFNEKFLNLYPMRAKGVKAEQIPWDNLDYQFEVKYDGDRRLLYLTNKGNKNTSRSKSRKTGLPVEKTDNVPHIRDFIIPELDKTILDCEFIHDRGFTEGVRKIMGCLPEKAVERQKKWGPIKVKLFDIVCYKGEFIDNKPYKERRKILEKIYNNYFINNEYFSLVRLVNGTPNELKKELDKIIENGGEGMVAKNIHSKYRLSTEKCMSPLKNAWIKIKRNFNGDFVITGYEKPNKIYDGEHIETHQFWEGDIPVTKYYYNNWIGALIISEYKDGELVERGTVSSGLTEDLRAEISHNPNKYIGKVIEVSGMERDKKSLNIRQPVFIRFREDKEPEDCIYENQKG